jgi:hypothetical protein
MEIPVEVTVSIFGNLRYSDEHVEILLTTHILEYRTMSDESGEISFNTGMTLPEVYGKYSSHSVHIGLKMPASKEELDSFENTLEPYLDRAMVYSRKVINQVLVSLEKPEKFSLPEIVDGEKES